MTETVRNDASRRRAFVLGCVFTVGLAAVALVLVVQERVTSDPFQPGTIHDVTLVRLNPCIAEWMVKPDEAHQWRTDGPVPSDWTDDSVEGTLQVDAEWGESTVVVGADTVNVFGGKLNGSRGFAASCAR